MSAPILVLTGANGFVGGHVAAEATAAGYDVWGVGRDAGPSEAFARHGGRYISADLAESWPVDAEVSAVVHLAGLAAVGPSFDAPQRYITVNSAIMTAMCESLMARSPRARCVVVSSGAIYAPPADSAPLHEESPLSPSSPYAVSKILVETQAQYYRGRGLDAVVARPFNHIGPGQGPGFLLPDLAHALAELGPDDELSVGNLAAARDFTDVRDVARAYVTLASSDENAHGVYNVASGAAHTGREVLDTLCEVLESPVPATRTNPARLRPNDPALIVGDASRLRDEHGWSPRYSWRDSVHDFVASSV
ncbi:NAD-dependent epimerase/dehydratase family protein [Microbacterium sp. cx-59]|uniref:NAD-dependent epimerase/dehydratase family protein n=1 Tax=Microbacterium sp. cx-59 TaxID=2891207 RepID=UPI001E33FD0C|nr:NAD-dependent epimerase/dehydratase family protein [Microbacterium sp. cx-59]MCC4907845.1 GDP-mannose 4,6-dehydratase [Microbacterium sp. cx-59]